jgi:hypothetical protein
MPSSRNVGRMEITSMIPLRFIELDLLRLSSESPVRTSKLLEENCDIESQAA